MGAEFTSLLHDTGGSGAWAGQEGCGGRGGDDFLHEKECPRMEDGLSLLQKMRVRVASCVTGNMDTTGGAGAGAGRHEQDAWAWALVFFSTREMAVWLG